MECMVQSLKTSRERENTVDRVGERQGALPLDEQSGQSPEKKSLEMTSLNLGTLGGVKAADGGGWEWGMGENEWNA
jgi:hypothetical protein